MSRQVDAIAEDKAADRHKKLVRALEFELDASLQASGAVLTGLSFRIDDYSCLMTIRAILDDEPNICFIGADNVINCIIKSVRDVRGDRARWRADGFARGLD